MTRLALAVSGLLLVAPARAADPTLVAIEVSAEHFLASVDGDAAAVVHDPAVARLQLLPLASGPDCAFVSRTLTPFSRIIASCAAGSTSPTCDVMHELIERVRFDTGTAGASRLHQSWHVVTRASTIADPAAAAAAVRAATGVTTVHLVTEPTPTGSPGPAVLSVKNGGSSWASLLAGWIDLGTPGASFDDTTGSWSTADNILACGIVAGEVELGWSQGVELSPQASPLSGADLVELYGLLAAGEPAGGGGSDEEHVVQIGARVGFALSAMDLPQGALAAATRFAFSNLYAPTRELLQLDDTELRQLASAGVSRPTVTWSAVFEP